MFVFCLCLPLSAYANNEGAVKEYIASIHEENKLGMASDTINGKLISYIPSPVDSNKVVVHWLYTVANYWGHRLTLLQIEGKKYSILHEISSKGEIDSIKFNSNILTVEQTVYAKGDARCCPSVDLTEKYKVNNNKMVLLSKN